MKVALIGYGRWGKNLYNALNKLDNIDRVLVFDPIFEKIDTKLKTINFEEIITDKDIKAVVISSPSKTHFNYTKELLQNNKNVFCEKPLCFTSKEISELQNIISIKKNILVTGHTFLFNDSINYLKDLIANKSLSFKTVSGKYSSFGTNIKDVDVLWDFGPHVLSIMNYLFDSAPIRSSIFPTSFREDGKVESCFIHLDYELPKVSVVFELSWLNIDKKREIEFNNYETLIRWDDLEPKKSIQVYEKQFKKEEIYGVFEHFHNIENNISIPFFTTREPIYNEMKYFIESIEKKEYKNIKSGIEFTSNIIKTLEYLSKKL